MFEAKVIEAIDYLANWLRHVHKENVRTHPTPAKETLLVFHLDPFLLFLRELFEETSTFSNDILDQLVW
jgi:hypothetical protein